MEDSDDGRKVIVHDDTHARAILLGIMRIARKAYMERYRAGAKKLEPGKYNRKRYREVCASARNTYGESLVYEEVVKHRRTKREETFFVAFGGLQYFDEPYSDIKSEKLYPITLEIVDSKYTPKLGMVRRIFDISEHALIRMIKRNQCSSMKDLVELIKKHIEPFIPASIGGLDGKPFVAVTGEAYLPCVIGEKGNIVVKTWISRASWKPETEAKLSQACNHLMELDAVALVPEDVFAHSVYMDPVSIEKYLVYRR